MTDGALLLSVTEAARLLGVGKTLAYEMARRGELPVIHLGGRVLVHRRALEEWLDRQVGRSPGDNGAPGVYPLAQPAARAALEGSCLGEGCRP